MVLAQKGLRHLSPARGAMVSIPFTTCVFWALSPLLVTFSDWQMDAVLRFALIGLFFPAAITLLSFDSNRLMGPHASGAIGNLAPFLAVGAGVILLDEQFGAFQWLGVAVIVVGVTVLSRDRRWKGVNWPLWAISLPLAAAALRGFAPPALKYGLNLWPDPHAAVLICYVMSASVALSLGYLRTRREPFVFPRTGVLWFMCVGLANGTAVLTWIEGLARGPVSLVSPVVACFPLFTLLIGAALLRQDRVYPLQIAGILLTVSGVVLLIVL